MKNNKKDEVFNDIMLDIETMGTGNNAAIISVAAVEFNIETGKTRHHIFKTIDLQSSLDLGLEVDASTIQWWMQQSKSAQLALRINNPKDIKDVLLSLSQFFWGNKDYVVWGNSARFDCGILENAFKKAKMPIPWDFRRERDVRTLVALKPEIKANHVFQGVPHNPLDDCFNQIIYCHETWNSLKH